MDIVVSTEKLKHFLIKCSIGGIIRDLVIHTKDKTAIFAKMVDKSGSMYAELYLSDVKVSEEGNIRIANLQKLISIIGQCETEVIRIKSSADAIAMSDGVGVGKFNANILQSSGAEMVESYDPIASNLAMFDKDVLSYSNGKINYINGCELHIGMLSQAIKDSKAFGYELFRMEVVKGLLKCKIENTQTTEKFTRTIADKGFIGSADSIPNTCVGMGFKEMVESLAKANMKDNIRLYITTEAWLITNGVDVFYNLNTLPE